MNKKKNFIAMDTIWSLPHFTWILIFWNILGFNVLQSSRLFYILITVIFSVICEWSVMIIYIWVMYWFISFLVVLKSIFFSYFSFSASCRPSPLSTLTQYHDYSDFSVLFSLFLPLSSSLTFYLYPCLGSWSLIGGYDKENLDKTKSSEVFLFLYIVGVHIKFLHWSLSDIHI